MVVPTFSRRTKLAQEILLKLREHFPKEIAQTTLGYSVSIDEAQSRSQTIFEYSPSSKIAKSMAALADELIARDPARVGR